MLKHRLYPIEWHGQKHCTSQGQVTFCTEELPRDVKCFASNDYDFLTVEQLLSHNAGQATEEMSLAIDHDLGIKMLILVDCTRPKYSHSSGIYSQRTRKLTSLRISKRESPSWQRTVVVAGRA